MKQHHNIGAGKLSAAFLHLCLSTGAVEWQCCCFAIILLHHAFPTSDVPIPILEIYAVSIQIHKGTLMFSRPVVTYAAALLRNPTGNEVDMKRDAKERSDKPSK